MGDDDLFDSEWFTRDGRRFRVLVIPESLPEWVPHWMTGPLSTMILLAVYHRRTGPPWKVVVYRRRLIDLREHVVARELTFDDVAAVNARAQALEAAVRIGALPGLPRD